MWFILTTATTTTTSTTTSNHTNNHALQFLRRTRVWRLDTTACCNLVLAVVRLRNSRQEGILHQDTYENLAFIRRYRCIHTTGNEWVWPNKIQWTRYTPTTCCYFNITTSWVHTLRKCLQHLTTTLQTSLLQRYSRLTSTRQLTRGWYTLNTSRIRRTSQWLPDQCRKVQWAEIGDLTTFSYVAPLMGTEVGGQLMTYNVTWEQDVFREDGFTCVNAVMTYWLGPVAHSQYLAINEKIWICAGNVNVSIWWKYLLLPGQHIEQIHRLVTPQ